MGSGETSPKLAQRASEGRAADADLRGELVRTKAGTGHQRHRGNRRDYMESAKVARLIVRDTEVPC